jgi:hypothetical protein
MATSSARSRKRDKANSPLPTPNCTIISTGINTPVKVAAWLTSVIRLKRKHLCFQNKAPRLKGRVHTNFQNYRAEPRPIRGNPCDNNIWKKYIIRLLFIRILSWVYNAAQNCFALAARSCGSDNSTSRSTACHRITCPWASGESLVELLEMKICVFELLMFEWNN